MLFFKRFATWHEFPIEVNLTLASNLKHYKNSIIAQHLFYHLMILLQDYNGEVISAEAKRDPYAAIILRLLSYYSHIRFMTESIDN